jgi:hypothetical protein
MHSCRGAILLDSKSNPRCGTKTSETESFLQDHDALMRYIDSGSGVYNLSRRMMSEGWQTKYGIRRVRRDPPTLEEAIFAATGITDDLDSQAEIAASLIGMPLDMVHAEIKKTARTVARSPTTRVIAGEQGALRSVVVERRVVRRFGNDKRI